MLAVQRPFTHILRSYIIGICDRKFRMETRVPVSSRKYSFLTAPEVAW